MQQIKRNIVCLVFLMLLSFLVVPVFSQVQKSIKKGEDSRKDLNILLGLPEEPGAEQLESLSDEAVLRRYKLSASLYMQGVKAASDGDINGAIERYNEAIRQLPAPQLSFRQLIIALQKLQKSGVEKGLIANGLSCEAGFQKGMELYSKGKIYDAILAWRELIKNEPQCLKPFNYMREADAKLDSIAETYFKQGLYYNQKGELVEAVATWRQGLLVSPENVPLKDQLAEFERRETAYSNAVIVEVDRLVKLQRRKEALDILNDAYRKTVSNETIKKKRDEVSKDNGEEVARQLKEINKLKEAGKSLDALELARLTLNSFPENVELSAIVRFLSERIEKEDRRTFLDNAFNQALTSISEGRFAEALDLLNLIKQDEPSYPGILGKIKIAEEGIAAIEQRKNNSDGFNKGLEQFNKGLFENALREWRAVLEKDPSNEILKKYIAESEKMAGNSVSERKKRTTDEAEVLKIINEARGAAAKRDFRTAISRYETALQKAPQSVSIAKELTVAKRELVLVEEKSVSRTDAKSEDLFVKGIDAYRNGKYKEAIDLWKQVTAMKPDHKKAQNYIVNVTAKLQKIASM